jgi:hypothetical protein
MVVWSSPRRTTAHLMYSDTRAAAHVEDKSVSAAACRMLCQPPKTIFLTRVCVLTKAAERPTECASSSSASEELSKQLFGAYLFVEHGSASSTSWSTLRRESRERRGSRGRCSREARLGIAAELVVL